METQEAAKAAQKYLRRVEKVKKSGTPEEVVACFREVLFSAPGNAQLQYEFGHALYWGMGIPENQAEAAEWLRRSADQDYPDALNNLGVMYELGVGGLPESGIEAAKLYRRSAEQGDTWAMGKLAGMYSAGAGIPKDSAESCFWYCITCECSGDPYDAFEAAQLRNRKASDLMDDDISAIRKRARVWLDEHPFGTFF